MSIVFKSTKKILIKHKINMTNEINSYKLPTCTATPDYIIPQKIYTTREGAILCRVKPCTIQKKVRLGYIKGQGRPLRILGSELLKLAA